MTGTIKTFSTEKGFEFIKGDNGKDYFFHKNNVKNKDLISDEALVNFEEKATPKGYSAINIKIEKQSNIEKYNVPETIFVSKEGKVNGWETIEKSDWFISGGSINSPDEAKRLMLERAKMIGANAVINMTYNKTTGEEPGTGTGTHYFSIHHFNGVAVSIGKKNLNGSKTKEELTIINKKAPVLKEYLKNKTESSENKTYFIWVILILISLFTGYMAYSNNNMGYYILAAILLFGGMATIRSTNYDSWLQKKVNFYKLQ